MGGRDGDYIMGFNPAEGVSESVFREWVEKNSAKIGWERELSDDQLIVRMNHYADIVRSCNSEGPLSLDSIDPQAGKAENILAKLMGEAHRRLDTDINWTPQIARKAVETEIAAGDFYDEFGGDYVMT
jgi:hypothetical protein